MVKQPPYLIDMSHLKMAIFLADWFDFHGHFINIISSNSQWCFLWIYMPMQVRLQSIMEIKM